MPRLPFYLVDAFVVEAAAAAAAAAPAGCAEPPPAAPTAPTGPPPLPSGNPAAVVLLPPGTPPLTHSALAAEFNQAETAFVELGEGEEGGRPSSFGLRWFTPTAEVVMCGHATLAAAGALAEAGRLPPGGEVGFDTLSGRLLVRRGEREEGEGEGEGEDGAGGCGPPTTALTLDLPARPPTDALPACADALVAAVLAPASPAIVVVATAFNAALGYLAVEISGGPHAIAALAPSPAALLAAAPPGASPLCGLVVVSLDRDGGACWRFFGPWIGIPEDAATGSAAAVVGPWLVGRGLVGGGGGGARAPGSSSSFRARQLSGRGGAMEVGLVEGGRAVRLGARVCVRVSGEVRV